MVMDKGHWHYDTDFDIEDYHGFVYQIENTANGKMYIGQKQFWSKLRRPPLKGKSRVRIDRMESNWKVYTGSSNELNADIAEVGSQHFLFEMLHLCNSKFELSYVENKLIYGTDAMINFDYYNRFASKLGFHGKKS